MILFTRVKTNKEDILHLDLIVVVVVVIVVVVVAVVVGELKLLSDTFFWFIQTRKMHT